MVFSALITLIAISSSALGHTLAPRGDPTPPDTYYYLGCYNDGDGTVGLNPSNEIRLFPVFYDNQYGETTDTCAQLCEGWTYFGTQFGYQCGCGDVIPPQQTSIGPCNVPCSGDGSEICGGGWLYSIYKFGVEPVVSSSMDMGVLSSTLAIAAAESSTAVLVEGTSSMGMGMGLDSSTTMSATVPALVSSIMVAETSTTMPTLSLSQDPATSSSSSPSSSKVESISTPIETSTLSFASFTTTIPTASHQSSQSQSHAQSKAITSTKPINANPEITTTSIPPIPYDPSLPNITISTTSTSTKTTTSCADASSSTSNHWNVTLTFSNLSSEKHRDASTFAILVLGLVAGIIGVL